MGIWSGVMCARWAIAWMRSVGVCESKLWRWRSRRLIEDEEKGGSSGTCGDGCVRFAGPVRAWSEM